MERWFLLVLIGLRIIRLSFAGSGVIALAVMVLSKARTIIGFLTEATDFAEDTSFAESADFAEDTNYA